MDRRVHTNFRKFQVQFQIPKLAMVDCFPNVFQASRGVDIIYQNYSLVEATMVCLEDLSTKPYKYVINLCAHDYPLKSNFQIVRSLKDCGSRMKKLKTVSSVSVVEE